MSLIGFEARADVPPFVTHQRRLFDGNGAAVSGTEDVTFTIYDAADGVNAIWIETLSVAFDDGFFSVQLGDAVPRDHGGRRPGDDSAGADPADQRLSSASRRPSCRRSKWAANPANYRASALKHGASKSQADEAAGRDARGQVRWLVGELLTHAPGEHAAAFITAAPREWGQRAEILLDADPIVPDLIARAYPVTSWATKLDTSSCSAAGIRADSCRSSTSQRRAFRAAWAQSTTATPRSATRSTRSRPGSATT